MLLIIQGRGESDPRFGVRGLRESQVRGSMNIINYCHYSFHYFYYYYTTNVLWAFGFFVDCGSELGSGCREKVTTISINRCQGSLAVRLEVGNLHVLEH